MSDLAERVLATARTIHDFPQPGIVFRDLTPVYADPLLFGELRDWLAALAGEATCIAGIEARGFVLGAPAALAAGIGFLPVRKAGKLPGECHSLSYDLEYGQATLEVQVGSLNPGDRVLIIDDVLATGGTARATADLVLACGATPVAVAVVLELDGLGGRDVVEPFTTVSLASI